MDKKAKHAAYMRQWRKTHLLSDEAKRKDASRSYAYVYLKRGKLDRQPCEMCGEDKTEMHHQDYGKPLAVIWLCRRCHLWVHANVPRET